MKIKFRQGSEELSQKAIDKSQIKLSKLARFIMERNYEALVYVDVERESGSHTSDKMWRASINLDLAGDRFNAVNVSSSQEKAIEGAIKELKRELQSARAKHHTIIKKSGGLLKYLRRGFS